MDLKSRLESALSTERQHLLHMIADVAGGLGFPIYMVGGSVRDLMLGRAINDIDLTIEGDAGALAESILRRIGGKIMIHSRFGTARWTPTESIYERLNVPVPQIMDFPPHLDFVSARSEIYTQPGALPTVKMSSIEDDLRRRDFTINAMAMRLDGINFGELLDVVDGQSDLERGMIRVLHPKSFVDDPTRMFRAIRYARRYDFEVDPDTLRLFNDGAKSILADLSGERLRHELDLMFDEENRIPMLERSKELGLLSVVHPALLRADHNRLIQINEKISESYGKIEVPDILSFTQTLEWILYLMNLSEKDIEGIAERLTFPVLLTKAVSAASSLYRDLPSFEDWKPSQWTFHLDELPSIAVFAVCLAVSEQHLREYLTTWRNIKPFTTGDDLKELGLDPGPRYKEILSRLRAAWLDGELKIREQETALRNHLIAE